MTKKMLHKQVDYLCGFSGSTLKDALKSITEMIEKYGEEATIDVEQEPYGNSFEINIYAGVLETDKEYEARLKSEQWYAERKAQRELEEFTRLKAKFQGN